MIQVYTYIHIYMYIYIYIYLYIYISSQILFPCSLLQDIEYSSLCYTVGPSCLSILYIVVCICCKRPTLYQTRKTS